MTDIDGLREAKRIAKRQADTVKGERSDWARIYRSGIKDVIAAIDREVAKLSSLDETP